MKNKYPKPPLNTIAGKLNTILYNKYLVIDQSEDIQKLFTFRNVIIHKWYKLMYMIWKWRDKIANPLKYLKIKPINEKDNKQD